jgi:hypothetical protein
MSNKIVPGLDESSGMRDAVGLDPWPEERPSYIVIVGTPQGTFVETSEGKRILKLSGAPIPPEEA